MSTNTGGRADKLGNRYEGRWVARLLLRLLAGEISVFLLEAAGDAEEGVDVWVTNPDGTRHAYQCKRKNRTSGQWTVNELHRQGVVAALARQLRSDPSAEFTFVSAIPAAGLRELGERARGTGGDAETFFQVTLAVQAHEANLVDFCRIAGVDRHLPTGRAEAYSLLRRTHTHLFEDSRDGDRELQSHARVHIGGDPAAAVETLANFALDRLGQSITVDDLRRHLRDRQFRLVNLAGDPSVAARLDRLRDEFRDSLLSGLALAAPIPRPEVETVLGLLDPSSRLIVVHGRAGDGKSTALLELTRRLEAAGTPYLPLRLDARPLTVSARRYGCDQCDLPESPAVVLRSVYPDRPAVLILDQLDAIRWTPSHGAARWEACREVIDEALAFPNLRVVLACRSFDLRDDQQIRTWLTDRQGREVALGPLPDSAVAAAVDAHGGDSRQLSGRQRELLRSPLLLSLWVQIRAQGSPVADWNTQTDLMREFWRSRFAAVDRTNVAADQARSAIDTLVRVLAERGEASAPAHALTSHSTALKAFESLGVLVEANRRVRFAHQSYFEYQQAIRLAERVAAAQITVLEWVRSGTQSLVLREPLRLLLTLLRDDSPPVFTRAVSDLVRATDVRFHLKQLVLGVLGDVPNPTPAEVDLAAALTAADESRRHIFNFSLLGRVGWFDTLDGRGLNAGWLASGDKTVLECALRLCTWVSGQRGDRVAALLVPYLTHPAPWPQRAAGALPFAAENDSDDLFRLRLSLIHEGVYAHRFLWADRLADQFPNRCLDLLEAYHDAPPIPAGSDAPRQHEFGMPYWVERHEVEPVTSVAQRLAGPFWNRLLPRIARTAERHRVDPDREPLPPFLGDRVWSLEEWRFAHEFRSPLTELVARAGAVLASEDPVAFREEIRTYDQHLSLSVQQTVGLALAGAEVSAAEVAVAWLLGNPARFSMPDSQGRRWGVARRILERHAAHCPEPTFRALETLLLRYHDPDERRSLNHRVTHIRRGWPLDPNRLGLTRYALLPALPLDRMSDIARSELGILQRKFGAPASDLASQSALVMRPVVSPIPAERAERITDDGWLRIMAPVARPVRRGRHLRVGDGHLTESSHEAFSRQLEQLARRHPRRFAALALRIPADTDSAYLDAIVSAIGNVSPPVQELSDWEPAADEQVVAVVECVGYRTEFELARGVCGLIQGRPHAAWPAGAHRLLARYATEHPNPEPGDWICTRGEEPELDSGALNCVRGIALGAIASILFESATHLGVFLPAIRSAIADPSPVVRVAVIRVCLAVLVSDADLAVDLFLQAAETDDRVLATINAHHFLAHTPASHRPRLDPLLRRMAASPYDAVAQAGASWLTLNWVHGRNPDPVLNRCRVGTPAQRRGVAATAGGHLGDRRVAAACRELLEELADDSDESVLEAVAECLRDRKLLDDPDVVTLAKRLAAGPVFASKPFWLLSAVAEWAGSLLPLADLILAVARRFAGDLATETGNPAGRLSHDHQQFVPVILRLYEEAEQAGDSALRDRCLDAWDGLLSAGVYGAVNATLELDQRG